MKKLSVSILMLAMLPFAHGQDATYGPVDANGNPIDLTQTEISAEKALQDAQLASLKTAMEAAYATWQATIPANNAKKAELAAATNAVNSAYAIWQAIEPNRPTYQNTINTTTDPAVKQAAQQSIATIDAAKAAYDAAVLNAGTIQTSYNNAQSASNTAEAAYRAAQATYLEYKAEYDVSWGEFAGSADNPLNPNPDPGPGVTGTVLPDGTVVTARGLVNAALQNPSATAFGVVRAGKGSAPFSSSGWGGYIQDKVNKLAVNPIANYANFIFNVVTTPTNFLIGSQTVIWNGDTSKLYTNSDSYIQSNPFPAQSTTFDIEKAAANGNFTSWWSASKKSIRWKKKKFYRYPVFINVYFGGRINDGYQVGVLNRAVRVNKLPDVKGILIVGDYRTGKWYRFPSTQMGYEIPWYPQHEIGGWGWVNNTYYPGIKTMADNAPLAPAFSANLQPYIDAINAAKASLDEAQSRVNSAKADVETKYRELHAVSSRYKDNFSKSITTRANAYFSTGNELYVSGLRYLNWNFFGNWMSPFKQERALASAVLQSYNQLVSIRGSISTWQSKLAAAEAAYAAALTTNPPKKLYYTWPLPEVTVGQRLELNSPVWFQCANGGWTFPDNAFVPDAPDSEVQNLH